MDKEKQDQLATTISSILQKELSKFPRFKKRKVSEMIARFSSKLAKKLLKPVVKENTKSKKSGIRKPAITNKKGKK
ncbi:MAG: hypothetical protein RIQ89_888 [Bacteroidota bacterium]|jgi:hypothetical protein